jgi:hypothetical protein
MEYAYLHKILTTAYLSKSGKPIFRPNERNDRAVWHKPVPKFDGWYFLNYRYAAPDHIMEVLDVSQGIEPDADPRDPRFDEVQRTIEAEKYIDKMTVEERSFSKKNVIKVRERAVRHTMDVLRAKYGADSVSDLVEAVARLFDVGTLMVRKVCGLAPKAKPQESQGYKEDPRWGHLRWAVHQARATAYAADVDARPGTPKAYGKFAPADALIKHNGERLYPEVCIVLGTVLSYDRFDGAGTSMAKVGRLDTDKPFEAGNVLLMSSMAVKLIEGLLDPSALPSETATKWEAWKDTHNVAALRPRARRGRSKADTTHA